MKIYPTIKEIRDLSGEDLVINLGSELKALAEIRQAVNLFYRILSNEVINETYNKMVYLIEKNKDWQDEFKSIIGSLIYEDWNSEKPKEEIVLSLINGSYLFKVKKVMLR